MITRDALYDFIENLIDDSASGDPLFEAVSFRNLRGPVSDTSRVVRVEALDGQHCMTTEDKRKELNVRATIQCWVSPTGSELTDIDDAVDASFDMSRSIFEAVASDTSLGGLVCDSYFDEFETGSANLGSAVRGVTYLDGTINQAS